MELYKQSSVSFITYNDNIRTKKVQINEFLSKLQNLFIMYHDIKFFLERTNQLSDKEEMKKRRLKWIRRTSQKSSNYITNQLLTWNREEKRKRRRSKNTLLRELKAVMNRMINNWKEPERIVQDKVSYKMLVGGLCSSIQGNRRK